MLVHGVRRPWRPRHRHPRPPHRLPKV